APSSSASTMPGAAGRGGRGGPIGRPEPVLDLPYHLSYPFVFERDGEVWMVPESCANRTVDLYRATAFPGGWVKEATLLSDIVASDATLVEHGGRWWLFATVRDGGGAFSDALHLWSAPDFRGPWTPHPKNPVLIDIASARPAGRMVEREGQLLRPVQDCRRSYGAALGIARIVHLDLDGMSQVVETILTPGALWSGRKLHTLNEAGGLEFIDGSAIAPRWKQTSGGR
ncbi:formyl transferase, partial [Mesorhizobium sp. B264B1A]|nr:formyl transferase [Mesorhizobium sp. B264B1A]